MLNNCRYLYSNNSLSGNRMTTVQTCWLWRSNLLGRANNQIRPATPPASGYRGDTSHSRFSCDNPSSVHGNEQFSCTGSAVMQEQAEQEQRPWHYCTVNPITCDSPDTLHKICCESVAGRRFRYICPITPGSRCCSLECAPTATPSRPLPLQAPTMCSQASFAQPSITVQITTPGVTVSFGFSTDWAPSSAQVPNVNVAFGPVPCGGNHPIGYPAWPGPLLAFVGAMDCGIASGGQETGGDTALGLRDEDWPMGEA
ncbi:hypothetical protein C8Q73DRAFT_475102 [Cubamyces lactineus]|nr:hypothetical protein C8Q73DRAFT_475102 [Cubamyces lactineus]